MMLFWLRIYLYTFLTCDWEFEKTANLALSIIPKKIGAGAFSNIYDLGNKVLKITTDITDAEASSLIAGHLLDGLVYVYGVYKNKDLKSRVGYYYFIVEDNSLVLLDKITKGSTAFIEFSGEKLDPWKINIINQKDIVMVYFIDSKQLFGFHLQFWIRAR